MGAARPVSVGDFTLAPDISAARRAHLGTATKRDSDLLATHDWTPRTGGRNNGIYSTYSETKRARIPCGYALFLLRLILRTNWPCRPR